LPRQNQQAPPPTNNQEQMVGALSFPQSPAIQVHGPPPPSEIRPTVRARVVFARPISNQVICPPSDNMVNVGAPVNFACPVSNQVHPSPPPPEKFVGSRIKTTPHLSSKKKAPKIAREDSKPRAAKFNWQPVHVKFLLSVIKKRYKKILQHGRFSQSNGNLFQMPCTKRVLKCLGINAYQNGET